MIPPQKSPILNVKWKHLVKLVKPVVLSFFLWILEECTAHVMEECTVQGWNSTEFALYWVVLTKIMLQDLELLTLATCQIDNFVPVDYKYSHQWTINTVTAFDHVGFERKITHESSNSIHLV